MATLTMIETPTSTAFRINEPASDSDDKYLDTPESDDSSTLLFQEEKSLDKSPPVEPDLLIVKSKPITATIRTTMKHLRAQAGRWSGFRGIILASVYRKLNSLLFFLLSQLSSGLLTHAVAFVATHVALAGLDMAWTHIVISLPSTRPWWRRIPSLDRVKAIIVPAAIYAVAEHACYLLPLALFKAFALDSYIHNPSLFQDATQQVRNGLIAKALLVVLVALVSGFLILIPATITLRRVQASMLPDEDEAIVPFDRTFNGKVQPVVAGGSGAVSMLDAWKTFDWAARIRYLKLQAKLVALFFTTTVMFVLILWGEHMMFGVVGEQEMKSMTPV